MNDTILAITLISAVTAIPALGLAIWHHWKFECHRHGARERGPD